MRQGRGLGSAGCSADLKGPVRGSSPLCFRSRGLRRLIPGVSGWCASVPDVAEQTEEPRVGCPAGVTCCALHRYQSSSWTAQMVGLRPADCPDRTDAGGRDRRAGPRLSRGRFLFAGFFCSSMPRTQSQTPSASGDKHAYQMRISLLRCTVEDAGVYMLVGAGPAGYGDPPGGP